MDVQPSTPGVKYFHQAKFHPLKYLSELVRAIPGKGSHVFENTESTEFSGQQPILIKAGGRCIAQVITLL